MILICSDTFCGAIHGERTSGPCFCFYLIILHSSHIAYGVCGFCICSRLAVLPYNLARYSDFNKPPQLLGIVPSYFSAFVPPRLPPYSPPSSKVTHPSSVSRSIHSTSHKPGLLSSLSSLLPTSVSSMNPRTSTSAAGPNNILRSTRSRLSLIGIFFAHSFRSMQPRCLRHFRQLSKRCATVCFFAPHHQHWASWTLPIRSR